jgi:DhnA family fructose-bisphosphate aldolase class Ia
MLPGGFAAKEVALEQLVVAARLGAELGVDIVKIRYAGPAEAFRQVVSACYCPVFVLGGSRQAPEQLLSEIGQALQAGAAGVAIGRNVWQHPDPEGMTRRIRETVHPA